MASRPLLSDIDGHQSTTVSAQEQNKTLAESSRLPHLNGTVANNNGHAVGAARNGDRHEVHKQAGRTKSTQSVQSSLFQQPPPQSAHQLSFAGPNGYPATLPAPTSNVQCPGRSVIDRCIGFYDDSDIIEEDTFTTTKKAIPQRPQPTARTISNKYLSTIGIRSPRDEHKSNVGASSISVSPPARKTGIAKIAPRKRSVPRVKAAATVNASAGNQLSTQQQNQPRVWFDDRSGGNYDKFRKQRRNTDTISRHSENENYPAEGKITSAPSSTQKSRVNISPSSPRMPFNPMLSTALPPEVRAELAPNPHTKKLPVWLRRLLVRLYDLPSEVAYQQEENDVQQLHDAVNLNVYAGSTDPLLLSVNASDDKSDGNCNCSLWQTFLNRCFGKILFWITVILAASSAGLTCTHSAFVMVDVARRSDNGTGGSGRRDWVQSSRLFDVMSDVAIDLLWVMFGIYSHNLAKSTLQQPRFFSKIRMHARDVLRINSIFIWLICLGCFLVVTEVEAYRRMIAAALYTTDLVPLSTTLAGDGEQKITWNAAICYSIITTRIAYAMVNFLWLGIMGCFVLSICRTHAVGILRLTHELDKDAKFYQQFVRENMTLVSSMVRLDEMRVPPKTDGAEVKPTTDDPALYFARQRRRPLYETRQSVGGPQLGAASSFSPRTSTAGVGISSLGGAATAALASQSARIAITASGVQRSMSLRRRAFAQSSSVMDVIGSPSASLSYTNFDQAMSARGDADGEGGDITASMRQYRQRRRNSSINNNTSLSLNEQEELDHEVEQSYDTKAAADNARQTANSNMAKTTNFGQDNVVAPSLLAGDDVVDTELNERIEQLSCNIMTNAELLYCYWKIKERMRATSVLFQSWLFIWFAFGIVWTFFDLISWLRIPPTLLDIALFVLPLLLLPLLGSAIAQANFNGQRMVAAICPLEHRVFILRMFNEMPLQLTVYGYHVTYTTLATSAVGVVLAIASKIILDELSPRK